MLLTPVFPVSPAPSAGHTVVSVKLWLDVADAPQQVTQHSLPITTVTGLNITHPLGRVAVHLHRTVAMGTEGLDTSTGSILEITAGEKTAMHTCTVLF